MNRYYHFPFVVVSKGVGTFRFEREGAEPKFTNSITGEQSDCRGVCITLEYFLANNARVNPANNPEKDYYISEGYGPEPLRLSGCTSIDGVLRYAELTSRNMFGRNESRGIVNRAIVHGYCEPQESRILPGEISAVKIKADAFEIRRDGSMLINDAVIGGEVYATTFKEKDRIKELEEQVDFLTGELQAAHATIDKVREIMRSEPSYDIQDHARVLRIMADAFAKLQQ